MDALKDARGFLNYQWGALSGSGTDAECIGVPIDAAARALLALAEEQRTANLIALLASEGAWDMIGRARRDTLAAEIIARLGLASDPS
jgi:hypothetical protein